MYVGCTWGLELYDHCDYMRRVKWDLHYMSTRVIWGLGLYEYSGYMRTGIIWGLELYEDWNYTSTRIQRCLSLYEDCDYVMTGFTRTEVIGALGLYYWGLWELYMDWICIRTCLMSLRAQIPMASIITNLNISDYFHIWIYLITSMITNLNTSDYFHDYELEYRITPTITIFNTW